MATHAATGHGQDADGAAAPPAGARGAREPRVAAPGAVASPPPASGVARADVRELLEAYRSALDLAASPPPPLALRWSWLTRLGAVLRPTWGLQRFTVEHVRRRVDALDRRYCLRLAMGEDDGNDADDREALGRFAASLPPPRPRFWALAPVLLVLGLSQVLVAAFGNLPGERETFSEVAKVVDLNPGHFNDAVDALIDSSFEVVLDLVIVVALSIYAVFRPLLTGFRVHRVTMNLPRVIRPRTGRWPLGRRATEIDVHGREAALFETLAMRSPPESAFDLWVKGTIVIAWIAGGLLLLLDAPDRPAALGLAVLGACLLRLGWLVLVARRRTLTRNELVLSHTRAPVGGEGEESAGPGTAAARPSTA